MADTSHESARRGHHEARIEHMTWLDEIREWRLEHRRALIRIQGLIELHEAELNSAVDAIEDHEIMIQEHDLSIAAHESGGDGEDHEALARLHEAAERRHAGLAKAHEAMRTRHEAFRDAVRSLLQSVSD